MRTNKLHLITIPAMIAAMLAFVVGTAVAVPGPTENCEDQSMIKTTLTSFTQNDNGFMPDVNMTSKMYNAGNRGCNSCHADLWQLTFDFEPTHLITNYGFGKAGTVTDCLDCHSVNVGTGGPYLGDIIHTMHYGSPAFNATDANCWNCHVMVTTENFTLENAEDGDWKLWEEVVYTPGFGGYPVAVSESDRWWTATHDYNSDFRSGVTTTAELNADVAIVQDICDEADIYLVDNWGPVDDMANWDEWTLNVTGVNNPGQLTLDDIKAMPQTSVTCYRTCVVNAVNGALVGNQEYVGVSLADLIDAMGGLVEGANQMYPFGVDGWTGGTTDGMDIQHLIDAGTIIAYETYGHELSFSEGYPVTMVIPGRGGNNSVKSLVEIDFVAQDEPSDPGDQAWGMAGIMNHINSAWFDNDGVTGKVGEPMELEGFSLVYTYNHPEGLADIRFSADYGMNWEVIDVAGAYDFNQWLHWTFTWTPEAPGTYVLYANADSVDGYEQYASSPLIVVVEE